MNDFPNLTSALATSAPTRGEAAELAAAEAAEVDAELVRLRSCQHLVDSQRPLKTLLADPALFVDALALDH